VLAYYYIYLRNSQYHHDTNWHSGAADPFALLSRAFLHVFVPNNATKGQPIDGCVKEHPSDVLVGSANLWRYHSELGTQELV